MGGCKSENFWPTIKPFLTYKGTKISKDTILCEDNSLINDQEEICKIFNIFFVKVAQNIGNNSIPVNEEHPSIIKIKEDNDVAPDFNFQPVDQSFISKQIDKLNNKKATGYDGISAKLLKLAKPSIVVPVTDLVNTSLLTSKFPDSLKIAQVAPIHKKRTAL